MIPVNPFFSLKITGTGIIITKKGQGYTGTGIPVSHYFELKGTRSFPTPGISHPRSSPEPQASYRSNITLQMQNHGISLALRIYQLPLLSWSQLLLSLNSGGGDDPGPRMRWCGVKGEMRMIWVLHLLTLQFCSDIFKHLTEVRCVTGISKWKRCCSKRDHKH